ncbi:MAG TPA: hypothetical protein VOA87_20505 [Thermoanaerobaculia bacterium]|nr:hypothetical protein [Thermoanaerobaculia bacterium]
MRLVRTEEFRFENREYLVRVWTDDELTFTAAAFLDDAQATLCTYSVTLGTAAAYFGSADNGIAYLVGIVREDVEDKKAERWREIMRQSTARPGTT